MGRNAGIDIPVRETRGRPGIVDGRSEGVMDHVRIAPAVGPGVLRVAEADYVIGIEGLVLGGAVLVWLIRQD